MEITNCRGISGGKIIYSLITKFTDHKFLTKIKLWHLCPDAFINSKIIKLTASEQKLHNGHNEIQISISQDKNRTCNKNYANVHVTPSELLC